MTNRPRLRFLVVASLVALASAGVGQVPISADDGQQQRASDDREGGTGYDDNRSHATSRRRGCRDGCTLGQLGRRHGVLVGAAVDAVRLRDEAPYADAVVRHFNSVTPENDMKWTEVWPERDQWSWSDADAIVDFARRHQLSIQGTTLVWGQAFGNGLPDWLRSITDPVQFREAVVEGITTEVSRYRGKIDRWIVVNEPLRTFGSDLDPNPFLDRIGPDYLALAFRTANQADPAADLWLNENAVEYLPFKADALVELVRSLVTAGVPIDGVGIQTHLIADIPIAPGSFGSLVARLRGLGVEVAITEMDVPMGPTRDAAAQAAIYAQITGECLRAGCSEITVWGVDDSHTWLDDPGIRAALPTLGAFPIPCTPLLLGADYRPKPAYDAVAIQLAAQPLHRGPHHQHHGRPRRTH